jgi:hypothetical protein
MKWWKILIGIFLLLGGIWVVRYVTTPPPGQAIPDLGRDHVSVEQFAATTFNSNPQTSGPHLPTWVKPGIYEEPQHDGELIHALEHGYINISYNCEEGNGLQNASPSANLGQAEVTTGSPSTTLRTGAVNESDACKTLVGQLEDIARKKKLFKLIVVPRPTLDTTLALTAWTYVDKFDEFDAARIERFIDYHRDHGPEKTKD